MAERLFNELNRLAEPLTSPADTFLFRRDASSTSVYLLQKGSIALLWPDAEDIDPMEVLGPGSIIGLPAALNGAYSVSAKSVIDSELGVVSAVRVVELLECNPDLCRVAMRLMGQEVGRMRSLITRYSGRIEKVSRPH
ncbi:MAG: Crp/Fnr family transcriptional regulator [Acidobacteriota bacterium]